MFRSTRIFITTVLLGTVLAGQAFAHAHLKSAVPAIDGTAAAAPSEIALTFSEALNLKFSGATVTDAGGKPVATGDAKLVGTGDTGLTVPLAAPLAAGTYSVKWHVLSVDGHKTEGAYSFTVKP